MTYNCCVFAITRRRLDCIQDGSDTFLLSMQSHRDPTSSLLKHFGLSSIEWNSMHCRHSFSSSPDRTRQCPHSFSESNSRVLNVCPPSSPLAQSPTMREASIYAATLRVVRTAEENPSRAIWDDRLPLMDATKRPEDQRSALVGQDPMESIFTPLKLLFFAVLGSFPLRWRGESYSRDMLCKHRLYSRQSTHASGDSVIVPSLPSPVRFCRI